MMLSIVLPGDPNYVAHAMEAVAEMRARGLRPRTDTFNTLMQAAIANADFLQVRSRHPLRACACVHACKTVLQGLYFYRCTPVLDGRAQPLVLVFRK